MQILRSSLESPIWRLHFAPRPGEMTIALDVEGLTELLLLLREAHASDICRVLLLEGSSGIFCRGMALHKLPTSSPEDIEAGPRLYSEIILTLRSLRQPTLALVDGDAIAGGLGLAAAADLLLATERSRFGLPEIIWGLLPAMVLAILRERLPLQKLQRLALLGETVSAAEALSLGLIDYLVPDDAALQTTASRLCKALLRASPSAVVELKSFVASIAKLPFQEALAQGMAHTIEDILHPQTQAALFPILAGELPSWFLRSRLPPKPAPSSLPRAATSALPGPLLDVGGLPLSRALQNPITPTSSEAVESTSALFGPLLGLESPVTSTSSEAAENPVTSTSSEDAESPVTSDEHRLAKPAPSKRPKETSKA